MGNFGRGIAVAALWIIQNHSHRDASPAYRGVTAPIAKCQQLIGFDISRG
jgi:hypothetical protein